MTEKDYSQIYYDSLIVRHEPDGELICYLDRKRFTRSEMADILKIVLSVTNNFSVRGGHTLETHIDFNNNVEIYRGKKHE